MENRPLDFTISQLINNTDFDYTMLLEGILKGIKDIIGVYKPDGTIMFYNEAGYEFYNTTQKKIKGKRCYEMLGRNCRCEVCTTELAIKTRQLVRIEKYIPEIGRYMDCMCNPVIDNKGDIVLVIEQLRDITQYKRQLNSAAKIQRQALMKDFPMEDKAFMETIYIPAETVSGDNYLVHKVDDKLAIGIIYDVMGKGITAALNVSAVSVMFKEAIAKYRSPSYIIKYLNQKAGEYLNESYVAACCFSLDFNKNHVVIVGAGINRFIFKSSREYAKEQIAKGPFIGMFENSKFDEITIDFKQGDKFYFFTDGLDELVDNEEAKEVIFNLESLAAVKESIDTHVLANNSCSKDKKDDCTLLAIEIK